MLRGFTMDAMLKKNKDGLEWLEFESLQKFPELVHGVFLRQSGDFKVDFTLRKKVLDVLEVDGVAYARQVHGRSVEVIDQGGVVANPCDGLVTEKVGVALSILHADCQAALFYDPIQKVVANVHSGWRGSVQNIYRETIQVLKNRFHTRVEDLIVCISPSLGPENAEFREYRKELPEHFYPYQRKPGYFDFWKITEMQLRDEGVQQVEIAQICTYAGKADFFSYRRNKDHRRHASVIALIS